MALAIAVTLFALVLFVISKANANVISNYSRAALQVVWIWWIFPPAAMLVFSALWGRFHAAAILLLCIASSAVCGFLCAAMGPKSARLEWGLWGAMIGLLASGFIAARLH